MVNDKEDEIEELVVDYEIIETDDGNFFFTIDDSVIPHPTHSKYEFVTTTHQGRFGYHSFIMVEEMSSRKENRTKLVFVICPFLIKNNSEFAKILGNLIAKSDYGKKDISISILGRRAVSESQEKGHSTAEICSNPRKLVPGNYYGMDTGLATVSATYQEVFKLTSLVSEYSSPLCPYCCKA